MVSKLDDQLTARSAFLRHASIENRPDDAKPGMFDFMLCQHGADDETVLAVRSCLHKLQLPVPAGIDEYAGGFEGVMLPLNDYGIFIRIEKSQEDIKAKTFDRIDDSPYVLQPIVRIPAGKMMVELCPGVMPVSSPREVAHLKKALQQERIQFWDSHQANAGRLPVVTPGFPDGFPVVIDRLAVRRLSEGAGLAKLLMGGLFSKHKMEDDVQARFYAPVRAAFASAWPQDADAPDAEKMKAFWQICADQKEQGKLLDGWNHGTHTAQCDRIYVAQSAAHHYGAQVRGLHKR